MLPSEPSQNTNQISFPFEVCNLLLGKGGSGQVFLGRVSGSEDYVAIKKRYAKSDNNVTTINTASSKESATANVPQIPLIQGAQSTSLPAFGGRSVAAGDAGPLSQLECSESGQLYQRRELDLGEESVSQMVALSQQSSRHLPDTNNKSTAVAAPFPKARALMDEVTVLQFLGSHPQIVKFMGNYTTSKYISFFTMELMDSDVARELKEANECFQSESVCVATAYSILKALEYLHAHGVAHRDVKPGNVLLKKLTGAEDCPCMRLPPESGISKSPTEAKENLNSAGGGATSYVKAALGDFSAAHGVLSVDDDTFLNTRGTLHYKSPEQLMGRRSTVSSSITAVDLWGLGCTMYEMITGTRPFPGNSELQVLMSILDLVGSDIQSFPSTTKPSRLFQDMPVSEPFLDLLHRLLTLDASARPTASEALQHPVFRSIREAEARFRSSQNLLAEPAQPIIIGISLVLRYAPFTHLPQLRFSRISRAPLAPEPRNSTETPFFTYVASHSSAEGEAALSALTHYAQKDASSPHKEGSSNDENAGANAWKSEDKENVEAQTAAQLEHVQHRSPDTTMMSFMSESSYLHWSEIRPVAQTSALTASQPQHPPPQSTGSFDQRTSGRAVALFEVNTGNSPSPAMSCTKRQQQQQRQFSESSQYPSTSMYRNTVARALNISDSSIKIARTERSTSHADFDLSPVAATQLFSADTDLSTCVVPHAGMVVIPRQPLPVLRLKCGSTFTASNLRANSSFERGGGGNLSAAAAAMAKRGTEENVASDSTPFTTPRGNALLRTTAYVGHALCLSEEPDRFGRCSAGSCPSPQSCLNSLLTSPALLNRVQDVTSPHPSPIRPSDAPARSPFDVSVVDRSSLSLDDSRVGLGWVGGLGFDSEVASRAPADTRVSTTTAVLPSEGTDGMRQQEGEPSHIAAPVLTAARAEPQLSSCGGPARLSSTSLPSESPHVRRCLPRSVARDSAKQLLLAALPPSSSSTIVGGPAQNSNSDNSVSTAHVLPLPIPLSVAAGNRTPWVPSTSPSCSSSSLNGTPHRQRFSHGVLAASKGRSGSAIITVKSVSPEEARQIEREKQPLRNLDTNVSSSRFHDKKQQQWCAVRSLFAAPSAIPREQLTVPSYRATTTTTAYSQRHCTPSSTELGREASALPSREARQLSVTQLHPSVSLVETSALHLAGSAATLVHTPPPSVAPRSTQAIRMVSARRQCCSRESDCCTMAPCSVGRSSLKRFREELTNEDAVHTTNERSF